MPESAAPKVGSCCTVAEAAVEWLLLNDRARQGGEWDGAELDLVTSRLEKAVQDALEAKRDPTQHCEHDCLARPLPRRVYPESEITRDPIFLFQRRRWALRDLPPGWEMGDDVVQKEDNEDEFVSLNFEACYRRFGDDYIVSWWDTETVFFTREEGEAFGHAKAYKYRDGWRVYCVAARGTLTNLLKAVTSRPESNATA